MSAPPSPLPLPVVTPSACMVRADELHELLKREQEQNINSTDSDPAVDAYLKANAASTPDHIATEVHKRSCMHIFVCTEQHHLAHNIT